MTLSRWFLDDSETKTIAVMQDKESLIEPNSARDSRLSFKSNCAILNHCTTRVLKLTCDHKKNLKHGTVDYRITLKCDFSINTRME